MQLRWLAALLLATAQPPALAQAPTTLEGQSVAPEALQADIDRVMAARRIPGLSIALINDGRIVLHATRGKSDVAQDLPVTRDTVFEGASLSKPLFAQLVMSFVEEGRLDLDRPLVRYLPQDEVNRNPQAHGITARMVLTHRTGLPNWRNDNPKRGLGLGFVPGTGFEYSGEGYQYLGRVLAHIAGTDSKGLENLFQRRIAAPSGMERTSFIPGSDLRSLKATGYQAGKPVKAEGYSTQFGPAYAVHSEARDMANWLSALMAGRGLGRRAMAAYLAPQKIALPASYPGRAQGVVDWALGFSLVRVNGRLLHMHTGNNFGFSSLMAFDRRRRWGVVIFTNADQVSDALAQIALRLVGLPR